MVEFQKAASAVRFVALDELRGVAVIGVMMFHYARLCGLTWFGLGTLMPDFFFILSGFVLAHSYGPRLSQGKRDVWLDYIVRRFIRLYPLLFFSLLFSGGVIWGEIEWLHDFSPAILVQSLLRNLLFLPYFAKDPHRAYDALFPTDLPLWTLFFEAIGIFIIPLLLRRSNETLVIIAYSALAIAACYGMWFHQGPLGGFNRSNFPTGFAHVFYGFSMGIVIERAHQQLASRAEAPWLEKRLASWHWGIPVLYFFMAALLVIPAPSNGHYYYSLVLVAAPALIFAGSFMMPATALGRRFTHWLGEISYPLIASISRSTGLSYVCRPILGSATGRSFSLRPPYRPSLFPLRLADSTISPFAPAF